MPMCGLQKLGFLPKPIVAIVVDYAMSGVLVAQACKLWWWDIDAAMWWLLTEWNFNISTARIIIAYGKTQWKYLKRKAVHGSTLHRVKMNSHLHDECFQICQNPRTN